MNKTKLLGQTFTEYREVSNMLKMYTGSLFAAKIMEPSFGDGQFLIPIIERIVVHGRKNNITDLKIKNILNNNIHGFEIDEHFYNLALQNIEAKLMELNFTLKVPFKNLLNKTTFSDSNTKFDLVIGNPPYVRVQNFDKGISNLKTKFKLTHGNTDLFLLFIDFYLHKLSTNGQLIFIIPNSLGKSHSARLIREFMFNNGSIKYIDFEDKQLFAHASVYSAIFRFKNNDVNGRNTFQVGYKGTKMNMDKEGLFMPSNIVNIITEDLGVKNGIATLSDRFFIYDKKPDIEKEFVVRIYKGSRMTNAYWAIFPYKRIGDTVHRFHDATEMMKKAPKMFKLLSKYKNDLLNRSLERNSHWFEYGRSQAIRDVGHPKIVIDTLIKPGQDKLKVMKIPKNTLVFSGLYTIKDTINNYNNSMLIESLRFRAKDMRGGYKKISSSLLKNDR